jgi:hypothetical protein
MAIPPSVLAAAGTLLSSTPPSSVLSRSLHRFYMHILVLPHTIYAITTQIIDAQRVFSDENNNNNNNSEDDA